MIPVLMLSSCASMVTRQDQYLESVPLARDGDYFRAAQIIEEAKEDAYRQKDRVLYYLDLGMLLHWAGEYERSNEMLSLAEEAIEELFTESISKGIASGLLNDNALDYSGEDYEDIYLNVFKALNYIALDNPESAQVEIRRVQIKLNVLEDKYRKMVEEYNASSDAEGQLEYRENRFYNDVLARYLSLLLYRAEGAYDDARIDLESIREAWRTQQQIYHFPQPELPQTRSDRNGLALVNILSFTGLSPVKLADTIFLDSGVNMIYLTTTNQSDDFLTRNVGFDFIFIPGVDPGFHFKIQFPRLSDRSSNVSRVIVKFDGERVAELPVLEELETVARETFLLKQPLIVGKTIIRATVKNIAKEIGKDALEDEFGLLGFVAGFAADAAVDATENADLRISQFFTSDARAGEIAVEPGSYHVTVEYWNGKKLMASTDHGVREFLPNQLNLIESFVLQ